MSTIPVPARPAAGRHRWVPRMLAAVLLAITSGGAGFHGSPAEALPGTQIAGHRCRTTWPAGATKEDTLAALADISSIPGVLCDTDVWQIADGRLVVWHDPTWERVADPASLARAGLAPTDLVANATWEQVAQVLTRGGEPVPTLDQMIDAAGAAKVPLLVEVKNSVPDAAALVARAVAAHADVTYYRAPQGTKCTTTPLDPLKAAGARVGAILTPTGACQLTPAQAQQRGISLVRQDAGAATAGFIGGFHAVGIPVLVRGATATTSQDLVSRGADRLLVNNPRTALGWPPL